ncbi:MAG: tRNA pseudouridine synthase A [Solirubrobacteraceae bacterium]
MRSRITLEYSGGGFAGWARQPGARTVQEELERALAVVLRVDSVPVTVAGRTDAGVHAWGQVASYDGPPVLVASLNGLLPSDVAVLSCCHAPEGFDARRDATSRAYCYRVLARAARPALEAERVLHWPGALDLRALSACAEALVGVHDFTAFTPTETQHVRFERDVLAAFWRRAEASRGDAGGEPGDAGGEPVAMGGEPGDAGGELVATADSPGDAGGELLEFWIEADAFMRHMNRVLVGTMLQVADGRRSVSDFVALLEGRPRADAGPTAPAHGLYLAGVGYGGRRVLEK